MTISRQLHRIRTRRAQGLCGRCPGKADFNRTTQQPYTLCAGCRAKRNATRALGKREDAA
jgi:hypothetical protein